MDATYREGEPESTPGGGPLAGAALAAGLVCAAIALLLFIWLGYQVRVGEPTPFDLEAGATVRSLEHPTMTTIMWAASVYGAPRLLGPLGLVAAAIFLHRGWRRGALLTVALIAGAVLLDVGLKQAFGRVRPEAVYDFYPAPVSYSFPSGHALFAVCFFGGIAVLLSHRLSRRSHQILAWGLAVVLITAIGASRVYLGVHYPTDVVGGFSVGLVWVVTLALVDRLAERRRVR